MAVVFENELNRSVFLTLVWVCLVEAVIVLILNVVHPVLWERGNVFVTSRTAQYFSNRHSVESSFRAVADRVRASGCYRLGLILRGTSYEYPLWVLFDPRETGRVLRHVAPPGFSRDGFVESPSAPQSASCLWVCQGSRRCEKLRRTGATRRVSLPPFSVWAPPEPASNLP